MSIQYYHGTKEKVGSSQYTVAVVVPNKENLRIELWKLLGSNVKTIKLSVGIARLNPCDRYVKKTGREVALSHSAEIDFELLDIISEEDHYTVRLLSGDTLIKLYARHDSDKVRLVDADIER